MWDNLRRRWPRIYEVLEWIMLSLATASSLLALMIYLGVRAG